jgi:hypothetical protein
MLLVAMHLFFLLAFRDYYSHVMALALAGAAFGLNFQLTQLREQRRTDGAKSRERIRADILESILFLFFVALISSGVLLEKWLEISQQEYLAYVAALLGAIFLAGLAGEIYWQRRHLAGLDEDRRENYIANLKRTIILPYTLPRRR